MESSDMGLNSEPLRMLASRRIARSMDVKTRLLSAWKEYWQEFKLVLKDYPLLAWSVAIALPVLFVLLWAGIILVYNEYSRCRTNCELYRAQVGVEIKRRADLIPSLVIYVGRYSIHEKDVMQHISDARQVLASSNDLGQKMIAAKEMQTALAKLLGIVEQYPNLKAAEPVQSLIKEISNTENRIADWKGKYNESARVFNNMYTSIPTNYLAWCFGIRKPVPYIDTDEDLMRLFALKTGETRQR